MPHGFDPALGGLPLSTRLVLQEHQAADLGAAASALRAAAESSPDPDTPARRAAVRELRHIERLAVGVAADLRHLRHLLHHATPATPTDHRLN